MLCIKKNKCFVLRKINAFQLCCYYRKKKQTAYCNPFRPVETRLNLSKHVSIRSDLLKHVSRLPPLPLPPPPTPSPFSTFFFFGGGKGRGREGEGGGEATTTKTPRKGGGRSPPPPPQDFKQQQQKTKFSHSFFSLLCNLPLLPPRGFSLSPLLLLLLLKTT